MNKKHLVAFPAIMIKVGLKIGKYALTTPILKQIKIVSTCNIIWNVNILDRYLSSWVELW